MKTTIKTSLLVAMGLTVGSAMAVPPPDDIIVCESNSRYFMLHWDMLYGQSPYRQYYSCSQPYTAQNCATGQSSTESISAFQYARSCPIKAAPAVIGTVAPFDPELRPNPRPGAVAERFNSGALNPGQVQRPKPTSSSEAANLKPDARE